MNWGERLGDLRGWRDALRLNPTEEGARAYLRITHAWRLAGKLLRAGRFSMIAVGAIGSAVGLALGQFEVAHADGPPTCDAGGFPVSVPPDGPANACWDPDLGRLDIPAGEGTTVFVNVNDYCRTSPDFGLCASGVLMMDRWGVFGGSPDTVTVDPSSVGVRIVDGRDEGTDITLMFGKTARNGDAGAITILTPVAASSGPSEKAFDMGDYMWLGGFGAVGLVGLWAILGRPVGRWLRQRRLSARAEEREERREDEEVAKLLGLVGGAQSRGLLSKRLSAAEIARQAVESPRRMAAVVKAAVAQDREFRLPKPALVGVGSNIVGDQRIEPSGGQLKTADQALREAELTKRAEAVKQEGNDWYDRRSSQLVTARQDNWQRRRAQQERTNEEARRRGGVSKATIAAARGAEREARAAER